MEEIAERAETSIGSIYQFFPNKQALFEAAHAALPRQSARGSSTCFSRDPCSISRGKTFSTTGSMRSRCSTSKRPAFARCGVGLQLTDAVITEGEALNREFAKRIEVVLAAKLGELPAKQRPVVATMMVEILTAMMIVSARRPAESSALIAETKALFKRYLAPFVTPAPSVKEPKRRRAARAADAHGLRY